MEKRSVDFLAFLNQNALDNFDTRHLKLSNAAAIDQEVNVRLRADGLVTARRCGSFIYYALAGDGARAVLRSTALPSSTSPVSATLMISPSAGRPERSPRRC